MSRALKGLLPLFVAVWGALAAARAGLIPLRPIDREPVAVAWVAGAVLVAATLAALLAVAAGRFRRTYRRTRSGWRALGEAIAAVLPRWAAALAVLQLRLWSALGRWITLRYPRGQRAFSYHRRTGRLAPTLASLAAGIALAILAWGMVPAGALRIASVAVIGWLSLAVAGTYAALIVSPHTRTAGELVLRYGVVAAARVPLADIVEITAERRHNPTQRWSGARVTKNGGAVALAHVGRTDVTLRLRAPVAVHRLADSTAPVLTLRAVVDDPARFVEAVAPMARALSGA